MTVSELIRELQKFPPDTLVLKAHHSQHGSHWTTLDGWWPQMVTVVPHDSPFKAGSYYDGVRYPGDAKTIDALEI